MTSTSAAPNAPETPGETDAALFAALETAFGDELKDILNRFAGTCDQLCERLQQAAECAHWQEAVRVTLLIRDAAADLGLEPIARAARAFADAAYAQQPAHRLRNSAQTVVFEYERMRLALMAHFPELVAPGAYCIA